RGFDFLDRAWRFAFHLAVMGGAHDMLQRPADRILVPLLGHPARRRQPPREVVFIVMVGHRRSLGLLLYVWRADVFASGQQAAWFLAGISSTVYHGRRPG